MNVVHVDRVRRMIGGVMLCGGVLAATLGLGSGTAQAAVPSVQAVPTTGAGFAEYRPWFHPGHPYYGPRGFHAPPLFFAPRGYGFYGHYR